MQRLYKGLAISIAVLIVLFLGLPYFFGFAAKRYTTHFVAHTNTTLAHDFGLRVAVKDYKRGWFHSNATLLIQQQKTPDSQFETVQTVPVVIQHGPIFKAHGSYDVGLAVVRTKETQVDKSNPYTLAFDESISFNGTERAYVGLMTSKKQADFIPGIGFRRLQIEGTGDISAKSMDFLIKADDLHVKSVSEPFVSHVKRLTGRINMQYVKPKHWKGTVSLDVGPATMAFISDLNDKGALNAQFENISLSKLHFDTVELSKLLQQLMVLNAKNDIKQSHLFGEWVHWFQQVVSASVSSDTVISATGLKINTPMGPLHVKYHVSFPLLALKHDYFDVAMHDVGQFDLTVPHFHFVAPSKNMQFAVTNLSAQSFSNTMFMRRSKLAFDVAELESLQPKPSKADFYAAGFLFHGELTGSDKQFSQALQWHINKLCFTSNCFRNIESELHLKHLNSDALRKVSAAMKNVYQPNQSPQQKQQAILHWIGLMHAYVQMITPETQFDFSADMNSSKGDVSVKAGLSWPNLPKVTTIAALSAQADYHVKLQLPIAYLDDFFSTMKVQQAGHPAHQPPAKAQAAAWLHYLIHKGYLLKKNDTYLFDLSGKGSSVSINNKPWVMPTGAELGLAQPKPDTQSKPVQQPVSSVPGKAAPVQQPMISVPLQPKLPPVQQP